MTARPWLRQVWHHEPLWVEIWSGITAIGWAKFVLLMPLELEERQPYALLTRIASDGHWEAVGAALGCLQVAAALIVWRWSRHVRWGMALAATLFWLLLAWDLWLGNSSAPGCVVYGGWGIANMTSMFLLKFRRQANE